MLEMETDKQIANTTLHRLLEDTNAGAVLTGTINQLLWVESALAKGSHTLMERHPATTQDTLPTSAGIGCQGVAGAYSHIAGEQLFPQGEIHFYQEFTDVVQAVLSGQVDFGILPVENSSAGPVGEVLELLMSNPLYINRSVTIRIGHCLCIHPDTNPEAVTHVLSHPQALAQCRRFLSSKGYQPKRFSNTAAAAREVAGGPGTIACICSKRSAQLYKLRILQENIEDFSQNYTRFLCISRSNLLLPNADTITITLQLPHEPGALGRLLTRFAACNLDLTKLLSMPIASREFKVQFYLDFSGNIKDSRVVSLLSALGEESDSMRFLGNYPGDNSK